MKALFLLGRTRRSVGSLGEQLSEFQARLKLSDRGSIYNAGSDLVFWPIAVDPGRNRPNAHHAHEFCEHHKAILESGLLAEFVIGEFGRGMWTACQTGRIDEFKGESYMYGLTDNDDEAEADEDEDDEDDDGAWDEMYLDPPEDDPYANRLFYTGGIADWFSNLRITEETPSLNRKLMIIVGSQPDRPFLSSKIGGRFRERLGVRARVVLKGQGQDICAIAFEYDASCREFYEQMKGLLPPRLVEDFVVMDVGLKYSEGSQPITLYGAWASQREERRPSSKSNPTNTSERKSIKVEVVRRRFTPKKAS